MRSLQDNRKRGQWESLSSVSCYEKAGKLLRQINKLTAAQQMACRTAEQRVPYKVIETLRLL